MATKECSVATATLTIDSQEYCASEYTITSSAAANHYSCMASGVANAMVSGSGSRSFTATLTADNAGEADALRGVAGIGPGLVTFAGVVTTVNADASSSTITHGGTVTITTQDSSYSHGDVPTVSISGIFNGEFTEVIASV